MNVALLLLVLAASAEVALPAGAAQVAEESPVPAAVNPDALLQEIASLERRSVDRTYSLRERESAADRAIELRRDLIASTAEGEPRLPAWLTDQAGALLARLGRDGGDSAVLFALATPAQREAVFAGATEAAQHLVRAAPHAGTDERLAVRAPFFRGRAEALLAALSDGPARTAHAEAAIAAIGKLALVNTGPEGVRRVSIAAAYLRRSEPPIAADAQLAIEELAWVATGGDEGERSNAIAAPTRAEAWMGLLHAAAALGNLETGIERLKRAMNGPPFVEGGRGDALLIVLGSDAMSRVLVESAIARGNPGLLERAVEAQMALLARQDLGFRADALRPGALEKLAALSDAVPAELALPAGMRLARAIRMARDPALRGEAMAALEQIAEAPAGDGKADAAASFAADALWEWAVLLLQGSSAEEQLAAVDVLLRLAGEHPEHGRAAEALGAALSYARQVPGGEGAQAYRRGLVLATERYQHLSDIDLWRYERGRLALETGDEAEVRAALEAIRQQESRPPPHPDSRVLHQRLQTAVLEAIKGRLARARQRHDGAEVVRIAAQELEPEARRAVRWARSEGAGAAVALAGYEADLADALIEAGRVEGRALHQQLLKSGAAVAGGSPRLLLGVARGHLLAGDSQGAFGVLREVATALDAPGGGAADGQEVRREEFWHAWMLMLQILQQEAADSPEKSGAIRAHIRRLEAIDPDLGGEPWRMRIRQVRDAVG